MLDRLIAFLDRHSLAIGILAGIWFWSGSAVYAGFLTLPDMPQAAKTAHFWSSIVANAGWWGFLRPRIEARRKELAGPDTDEV